MQQIYPDGGLLKCLERMVYPDLEIRIFTNDITPTAATVYGDLTDSGATGIIVDWSDFVIQSVDGGVATAIASPVTVTNDSGSTKNGYGYYITPSTSNEVLAIARFDSAPISKEVSQGWQVIPIIGITGLPCS